MRQNQKNKVVSVVVASYNGKQFLKNCFESLYAQKFDGSLEIIFIDDNSADGSFEYVKKNFPDVIADKNYPQNLGHAESCNKGIKKCSGDYIFLIDNDTEFDQYCIRNLLEVFVSNPEAGCVGGMIKDYGDSNIIQDLGMDMDIFGYGYSKEGSINGFLTKDDGQYASLKECFYISSCALMISSQTLKKVGNFDNDYFMYKDDLDLCWRVRLIGKKIIINPKAVIFHKMGVTLGGTSVADGQKYSTTAKKRYYGERNTIATLLKNYMWYTLLWVVPVYFVINILEIIFFLLSFKINVVKAYGSAWAWNLGRLPKVFYARKVIAKFRNTGDFAMMRSMLLGSAKLQALLAVGIPKMK